MKNNIGDQFRLAFEICGVAVLDFLSDVSDLVEKVVVRPNKTGTAPKPRIDLEKN